MNGKMNDYTRETGKRIRMFRQAKGFTQTGFAEALHKTKSTISKYEHGDISMDLETLCDICRVLKIPASALLPPDEDDAAPGSKTQVGRLYMYNMSGRQGVLTRNLLEIYGSDPDQKEEASMFYGLPSFRAPEKCQGYYYGTIVSQDIFTHLHLINQKNNIEQVSICYRSNLDNLPFDIGLMSGLSFASMVPVTCKAVISTKPLPEDELLNRALCFDQAEIRRIRSTGIVALKRR